MHESKQIFKFCFKSRLNISASKMGVVEMAIFPTWIFGLLIFLGSIDPQEVIKPESALQPILQVWSYIRA